MIEYLVVVYLTFMDGSVSKYNDGKWDTATSYEECKQKIAAATKEMKEEFKDYKPAPSTFIQGCVQKK